MLSLPTRCLATSLFVDNAATCLLYLIINSVYNNLTLSLTLNITDNPFSTWNISNWSKWYVTEIIDDWRGRNGADKSEGDVLLREMGTRIWIYNYSDGPTPNLYWKGSLINQWSKYFLCKKSWGNYGLNNNYNVVRNTICTHSKKT